MQSTTSRIVRLIGQAVTAWGPLTIQRLRDALGIDDPKSAAGMSLAGILGARNPKRWHKTGEQWSFSKWDEGSPCEGEEISRHPLPPEAIPAVRAARENYRSDKR